MSLSEESGDRILASRHVSQELNHHENNAMNTTLLCHNFTLEPDFISYLTALQPYVWVVWSSGLIVLVLLWTIYAITLRSALKKRHDSKTNLATVLSVYPLVASAAFIAIVVPRATLVAEAIAQEVVMVALYHFFCLIIAECGGPSQFIRRSGDSPLETRVLPCCCWPCCFIPRPKIDKRSLTWLRCLVLQIPIVQAVLYVIILVLWAEDMMIYRHGLVFIQFFVAASILSGIWGVIMCVRAASGIGVVLRPKFVALQLVLIIVKLQCSLAKLVSDVATLPCVMSLHPAVLVNATQYTITIFEMLLLSIWAWRLYGGAETKSLNKVQKVVVAVLEEGTGVRDVKQIKGGVDNKSFSITDNKCEEKV